MPKMLIINHARRQWAWAVSCPDGWEIADSAPRGYVYQPFAEEVLIG